MAFDTEYTEYFAKKLSKKLKPKIGKTKTLGNIQISKLETKSMLKLNQTQLYRLILTGQTNESSEFFQSPVKVTQLLNMESDTFNQKMLTAFSENSGRQPLSSVDIDDMKRLEARYKYYLADSYFTEGALTMEIYIQVVHEDDLQIIESALKDVENYELEKVNIIEESKLNSSSCCGLYLLEHEESRILSFFVNKQ